MIKHANQRVGVFIDTSNMYHSAKNLFNARVNFKAVLDSAVAGRQLIRAIAYVVRTKTGEEKPFFDALTSLGIETREKELMEYESGLKKADWDVGIAVDAIRIASLLDVVVLCSGDGDFHPLLEYLRNQGRQVEVIAFGKTTSGKLKEIADVFIDLSADEDLYLIPAGSRPESGRSAIIRGGKRLPV